METFWIDNQIIPSRQKVTFSCTSSEELNENFCWLLTNGKKWDCVNFVVYS